ncbi:TniQ family protein [Acidovorax sp.]|uniref:TniQ family protein n=1 Tax=Acidovorax sp. TaxID=1872122 RepID=UPI0025B9983F|nr:TniQ family protein [Acidovorax sp.]
MGVAPYLPIVVESESLYGWCSYVHQITCNTSSAKTSLSLFGSAHGMRQFDIPPRIAQLAKLMEHSPSVHSLVQDHTVARAYLPFASLAVQKETIDAAEHCAPFWRRAALQISRSRFIEHPLRLCTACVESDCKVHGRPLWHVDHQLPGACGCLIHKRALRVAPAPSKRWLTPDDAVSISQPIDCSLQLGLACAAVSRAAGQQVVIDTQNLVRAACSRLMEMGVLHSTKRVEHRRLVDWFTSSPVGRLCTAQRTGLAAIADGSWIAGHLWRHHRTNAARWIVLWSALGWETWSEAESSFVAACQGRPVFGGKQRPLWDSLEDRGIRAPQQVQVAFAVCNSYAEAMDHLGCTRADISRWLKKDEQLRLEWKQRLVQLRVQDILDRIHLGNPTEAPHTALADHDFRWLKLKRPDLYAQTGMASTSQSSLF